jgi:transcriptional regulator with XRE-family HTH domain
MVSTGAMNACSSSRASVLLRDALAAAHLNQAGVAADLGVSRQAISAWLCGRCRPSLPLMLVIQERFGVPLPAWTRADEGVAGVRAATVRERPAAPKRAARRAS